MRNPIRISPIFAFEFPACCHFEILWRFSVAAIVKKFVTTAEAPFKKGYPEPTAALLDYYWFPIELSTTGVTIKKNLLYQRIFHSVNHYLIRSINNFIVGNSFNYNRKWSELFFWAKTFLILHFSKTFWLSVITCFAVISRITRFTITAITSRKIDTRGSVLAWIVRALVYNSRAVRKLSLH